MDCQPTWAEAKLFWRPFLLKYQEDQRLRKYFRRLAQEFPNPPKGWEEVARPCKWKQLLEEDEKAKKNVE